MRADAEAREPERGRRPGLWEVPDVISLEVKLAEYDLPQVTYRGIERVEYRRAVELLVTTSDEIVARAITPALLVGDVAVREYETVGEKRYLFVVPEPERLEEGAPISLGWPEYPGFTRRTRFSYHAPDGSSASRSST